jgi:hypothetical protein
VGIRGSKKLIEVFGRWPSFHDAEVVRFTLDRAGSGEDDGPAAECTIHVFEMTNEVDKAGYFVLKNHVLVTLRFAEVAESEFGGFNGQNALWGLEIEDVSDRQPERVKYVVTFRESYGFAGSLECLSIEVTQVIPCDASGGIVGSEPARSSTVRTQGLPRSGPS